MRRRLEQLRHRESLTGVQEKKEIGKTGSQSSSGPVDDAWHGLMDVTVSHTHATSHHAHTSIRTAARIVGGFCKLYYVSHYMRHVLHWLPVSQRIPFTISVWVWGAPQPTCVSSVAPPQVLLPADI